MTAFVSGLSAALHAIRGIKRNARNLSGPAGAWPRHAGSRRGRMRYRTLTFADYASAAKNTNEFWRHSSGVLEPFARLQGLHAVTRFSNALDPPRLSGRMWSPSR